MAKISIYGAMAQVVEEMDFDEARLGGTVRKELIRQAVITYGANQRQGTAKVKTRGEVNHPNKKPWPQKHTGRARAGTPNSPIWVGGGVSHGPVPRDYSQKLNKKMRKRAVESAILAKIQAGELKIIDSLELPAQKTKEMARLIRGIGAQRSFLLVVSKHDPDLWRCARNIRGAAMTPVLGLNTYHILKARDVVFTREAFDQLLRGVEPTATAEKAGDAKGE